MWLATGYIVTVCRTDNEIYGQDIRCNEGRIINIISATVGYSEDDDEDEDRSPTSHSKICPISDHVQCRQHTNSPEIMKCNGRVNCMLGLGAFNYLKTCHGWQTGNVINITYICIAGKRTCFKIRIFTICTLKRWLYYNDQICPNPSSTLEPLFKFTPCQVITVHDRHRQL